mmetsp:Transcript_15843/g.27301  ORF Transcript_15843/g.27301 Transcript_15843/m.27301 type:complete len:466 (-) Transcript_15843:627-2024(-)
MGVNDKELREPRKGDVEAPNVKLLDGSTLDSAGPHNGASRPVVLDISQSSTRVSLTVPDKKAAKIRRYDVDWLRVYLTFNVLFYHAGTTYQTGFGIQDMTSDFAAILMPWLLNWPMQVFFALAGVGTYFSLRSRTWTEFMKERSLRILPPAVVGMLIFQPTAEAATYFCAGTWPGLGEFLKGYVFTANLKVEGPYWFIEYLYLYSFLSLPLFLGLKKTTPPRIDLSSRRTQVIFYSILVVGVPILFFIMDQLFLSSELLSTMIFMTYRDPFTTWLVYIFGYLTAWCYDIQLGLDKFAWVWTALGTITTVGYISCMELTTSTALVTAGFWWSMCWYLQLAHQAWFHKLFQNKTNKFLVWATEAFFPINVIHPVLLTWIEYCFFCLISTFPRSIALRWTSMLALTMLASFIMYQYVCYPFRPLRFLIGLGTRPPAVKPAPKPNQPTSNEQAAADSSSNKVVPSGIAA